MPDSFQSDTFQPDSFTPDSSSPAGAAINVPPGFLQQVLSQLTPQTAYQMSPLPAAKQILQGNLDEGKKAWDSLMGNGDYSKWSPTDRMLGAATDALSAAVPVVGPLAHSAVQNIQSGNYGQAALDAAGVALPEFAPAILGRLRGLVPSSKAAGEALDTVMTNAKDIPLDVTNSGSAALRAAELGKAGNSVPGVINSYLDRVTGDQAPLTFSEARDFYSSATRLSSSEYANMSPVMQKQLNTFKDALGDELADAAGQVGYGNQYRQAIADYARAASNKRIGSIVVKKGLPYLGVGAASAKGAYDIYKELR
jgi:hypothetical protein